MSDKQANDLKKENPRYGSFDYRPKFLNEDSTVADELDQQKESEQKRRRVYQTNSDSDGDNFHKQQAAIFEEKASSQPCRTSTPKEIRNALSTESEIPHSSYEEEPRDSKTNSSIRVERSLRQVSRHQWLSLAGVCYVNLASNATMTILSGFFTKEAHAHSVNDFEVGLIFGIYAIINTLLSPVFGAFIPKFGTKPMLLFGLMTSSVTSFIFSQLYRFTSTALFVSGCLIVRAVQAVGCAAYYTAATVIIARIWIDNVTFAMGLSEVFTGLGMIFGPLLGGWLYQVGGFQLPFVITGSVMLLGLIFNHFVVSDVPGSATTANFLELIKIPNVAATAILMCAMWAAMDFNMPLLYIHMQALKENSPVLVGVMFLLLAVSYTVCAPLIGVFAKTKEAERTMMIVGGCLVTFSYLVIGPSPIFYFFDFTEVSITNITVSMILLGIGLSLAIVPSFSDLKHSAVDGGMSDDISTSGIVGGLYNSVIFLGEFVGPIIGGSLMQGIHDYKLISSIFAAFILILVSSVATFYIFDWRKSRQRSPVGVVYSRENPEEHTPLLH